MKKNDEIILEITDITREGSGVGKYNDMVIFVPLTAIGDIARVKILKVKKSFCYGKAEEILTPSKDRITPDCDVFSKCGGCVYRHMAYSAECALKENQVYEVIKRIGKTDLKPNKIIGAEYTERYRNKAQFPISCDGKAGFYAFHSHRIIPCNNCLLQPEIFAAIVAVFEEWISDFGINIYDETAHTGLLRHIYIRLAEKTQEIMVTAVINGNSLPHSDQLVERLKNVCGSALKSVQLNINKTDTNVILGDKCKVLYGQEYITDILCGVRVRLSPLSFYQVNRTMAERLYEKAAEYAEPTNKTVLDLYCGAGTIGLSMAKRAKKIIGVEIVPEAVEDAKFNARLGSIQNAEFICADAADAAEKLAKSGISADVVIVDPPRKGCSEELIGTIAEKFSPERVVYVSCDPATLARDMEIFSHLGYTLKEYTPVDLFPRTAHVETVALLVQTVSSI
ncbi:MAG: 23S rRNA (uracil(1939)-C(5))-methyltransferase RlmD [Ruminococcaceae bacterium]|nr:23S rRNA (uracil(1939)-C(5))-methyltransferase RlmD [Oscillospiraceae bacterium]